MSDFLEKNICGQTLLELVSRGNAIIAELLRLKHYIPNVYKQTKSNNSKYADIIFDFSYLDNADAHEQKIDSNAKLRELDDEFKDNYIQIINRFYLAFESIHTYVTDLNSFLEDLQDGCYIHQTLEVVFSNVDGKQMMCEALHLYGTMLLLVDYYFEGVLRERMLVSYYRYTPQRRDTPTCIDAVCKLFRGTGFSSNKKPNNYPEDYFKRISIKESYVDMVIGKLRSDDIYNQLAVYPLPKHRTLALTTQASMLYVCLFFSPSILHSQTSVMREIVDKYFSDNWIISIYMGGCVNLVDSWENFKAARLALSNTIEGVNVKDYATRYGAGVYELLNTTTRLLKEGTLTPDNVLVNIDNILNVLRNCNATIRWLMLHAYDISKTKRSKQLRELILHESKYNSSDLFKLLLNTAQLELIIKELFKNLIQEKTNIWEKLKKDCISCLLELSEVFSGVKPLTRVEKNTNLQKWFVEISKQIESLEEPNKVSSMKIVHLIQALEEVQGYHQIESNMQVIQVLTEIRKYLNQMICNMKIQEDVLISVQIIADISYAWEIIDCYTQIMQTGIKSEPTLVTKLRAVFLKLSSTLEIPLLRINQAHSEDFESVSQYYSNELEIYIRNVLQIIPKMIFAKLARIIEMQTSVLKEMPTRFEKDKLKEYAQLNERFEIAELTHSISVFSEGMRMMKSTLVGVVCLDPKEILEDGIRKELVQHISKALHEQLIFTSKIKAEDLNSKLKCLGQIMDGYKRSFEYIQDYININGLKIWQEEVTRIINYNVEQECNSFMRNKVHDWESVFQSRYVPIPSYPSTDNISNNFIGRLARELLKLTDARSTIYIKETSTWYDIKTQKSVLNKETFTYIINALEITGLVGLDRLFACMIVANLTHVYGVLENKSDRNKSWSNILSIINDEISAWGDNQNVLKFYGNCVNRATKLFIPMVDNVLLMGQLQILRVLCCFHLNSKCKFDAKNLEASLSVLNKALLFEMEKTEIPEATLRNISKYFDYAGLNNPLNKVYLTCRDNETYATHIFVMTLCYLSKLYLHTSGTQPKKVFEMDGNAFIFGVHTLLHQFNANINRLYIERMTTFLQYLGRYSLKSKSDLPAECYLIVKFLDNYCSNSNNSHKFYLETMPMELQHLYKSVINNP